MKAVCSLLLVVFSLHGHAFAQGSLIPPGAPAPTMKSLAQIEPRTDVATLPGDPGDQFVISAPGSYYLSTNVTVTVASKNGIGVTASNVTLDLNGYTVSRNGIAVSQSGEGVHCGGSNVSVRNGTVTGWANGINAAGAEYAHLDNVHATGNNIGVQTGTGATISHCDANENPVYGFSVGSQTILTDCTALSNNSEAFGLSDFCQMRGCVAEYGTYGIAANNGCILTDCQVSNCSSAGIILSNGSTATGCNVSSSGGYGYYAEGATLTNCTAFNNSTYGIQAAGNASLFNCTATNSSSGGSGIYVSSSGNRVVNCLACTNNGSGIILVAGAVNNRIEGNTVYNNTAGGLTVNNTATNNLIIRNNARGNSTPYSLGTGANDVGPVGAAATSTNPNGNFQ